MPPKRGTRATLLLRLWCLCVGHRWQYVNKDSAKPLRSCPRCRKQQELCQYMIWSHTSEPRKWSKWETI